MPWISRDTSPPPVPVHRQYSSLLTSVEKVILYTLRQLFFWTASNSYTVSKFLSRPSTLFTPQPLETRRNKKRDPDARRGATQYGESVCSWVRCRQQTVNCSLKSLQLWCSQKHIHQVRSSGREGLYSLQSGQDIESGRLVPCDSHFSA